MVVAEAVLSGELQRATKGGMCDNSFGGLTSALQARTRESGVGVLIYKGETPLDEELEGIHWDSSLLVTSLTPKIVCIRRLGGIRFSEDPPD